MYYVYILRLRNNSIYVGSTSDIQKRLKEHNSGKSLSTKDQRPIELVWYCAFENKRKALEFEKYLKTGSGISFRHRRLE